MGSSVILPPAGQPATGPDKSFVPSARPALVTFNFNNLTPPSNLYVQRDDQLLVVPFASVAGAIVQVTGRLLQPIGSLPGQPDHAPASPLEDPTLRYGLIVPFQFNIATIADRAFHNNFFPLGEGYLLGVSAVVNNPTTIKRGQVFCKVGFQRAPGTGFTEQMLLSDYLIGFEDVGWPGGRVINSLDGAGFLHSINVANPVAGADWTFTVPNGARMRIQSFHATFTAANAGAPRIIEALVKDNAANNLYRAAAQQTIAINSASQVTGSPGQVTTTIDTASTNLPIPSPLMLSEGQTVGTNTTNINAADTWTNIWLEVEEWIEPH